MYASDLPEEIEKFELLLGPTSTARVLACHDLSVGRELLRLVSTHLMRYVHVHHHVQT